MTAGRRRTARNWLMALLAGTSTMLAAALSAATNIATGRLPGWLSWADNAAVAWTATVALAAVVVLAAVVLQRLGTTDAPTPEAGLRVFGSIPRPAAHFQRRPAELRALRTEMGTKGRAALVALPGLRGAGKSQLAAAYARACADQGFDLVVWINAESGPVADLALVARHLDLGDTATDPPEVLARLVVTWLQNQDRGRRLVVFDNVDDPDAVTPYVPRAGTTKILVTTNREDFADATGFTPVQVGMFSPPQGLSFLTAATGLAATEDARRLGEELGWLPLGLAQAGAYIAANRLSYAAYLAMLDRHELDEALRRRPGTEHPGVLKATALTVAGLARWDPSGDAARLLGSLALLSPDGVSRHLLERAAEALELTGRVGPPLDALASASLVTLSSTGRHDAVVVVLHRLTGRTIRHLYSLPGADPPLPTDQAVAFIDRLAAGMPDIELFGRRAELDEIVSHVLTLRGHIAEPGALLISRLEWAGRSLREVGDPGRAIAILEDAVDAGNTFAGAENPETLRIRHSLAEAFDSAGRFDDAIAEYRLILAVRLRVLGPDDRDTLQTRHGLADAYESAGRFDEAIAGYRDLLEDSLHILGADSPDNLATRHNLGFAYYRAGRFDEAITCLQQVLADGARTLGADDRQVRSARHHLADAYESAGRFDEAIRGYEQVLADDLRILGPDHPNTLITRHNLAYACRSAGRLDEAIAGFQRVLADQRRVLGPDDPSIVITRRNLERAIQERNQR
ncbi:tetratricopeptide repeat protein [Dactylosporangium sp. AC04546]|uniref:tetratricopeptide repeat protein n=1 Tax=Dactylosporangium sp. AC04546 TaxID=2862460 RepID=UPI001EE010BE|nr:tetratricopeptide repeat protein [Dactylosporangium sp. AC04546]WVK80189.1 tetratricopeptide repeat protein [Dactylosporangium sp. AC04546]